MKINVQKLGAGAGLRYVPLPIIPTQGEVPQTSESTKNSEDSQLKGKALSSDAKVFQEQYNTALNQYNSLPPQVRESIQGRVLREKIKGNWANMTVLANAKERLDRLTVDKKDAASEFAVFQGHVVAQDKETGDIVNMSLPEYSQSLNTESPKYKALTNGELINLREGDVRFAGKDNVFPILDNAVSTETVLKNVRAALQNLGSYSKGTAETSYEQKRIEDGANAALNQGLSYVKTSQGDYNQSNAENIKMAGNAMWAMLDDASKDLLRVKAIHYGYKSEQIEGAAMGLALAMLKPAIQEKITEKEGEALGRVPGTKSAGGTGKKVDIDYWSGLASGKTGAREELIQLPGDNSKTVLKGFTFPPFMATKDTFYGETTLDKIDKLGAITDMNSVYFGNQKIDTSKLNSILYDGKAKPAVVWLPFEEDEQGGVRPNLDRAQDLSDIKKKIEEQNITSPEIKIKMYQEARFYSFDNMGEPSETVELMPFVSFSGYSNTMAVNEDSKWQEMKEDRNDWYKKATSEKVGNKIVPNSQYYNLWTSFEPDVVKGMIYIPLVAGATVKGMYASGNLPQTEEEFTDISSYEGTNLGQLGGGRTFRQLDPNINLDKNVLNQTK